MAAKKAKAGKNQIKALGRALDSNATLDNLREIYAKLDRVDAQSLDDDEYKKWREQYSSTRKAIMVLETADFEALDQEHKAMAADISAAIDQAEDALHGIQDGARIIKIVGLVAASSAKLVTLFG